MNIEVELPDLGPEGGDEATIAEWRFEEGDTFEKGDVLLEALSAAGTVEVRCPDSGSLIERLVEEDERVRIGDPLALIEVPDEADFLKNEQ